MNLVTYFQEFSRIKNVVQMAEEMEKKKAAVRKPIEDFLRIMNDFIKNSDDGKILEISPEGRLYFKTKYSGDKIAIEHLSSGEKQLITFFANLIFNVKNDSSGIFVVDEPEISLHLSWQKVFVDKALELK